MPAAAAAGTLTEGCSPRRGLRAVAPEEICRGFSTFQLDPEPPTTTAGSVGPSDGLGDFFRSLHKLETLKSLHFELEVVVLEEEFLLLVVEVVEVVIAVVVISITRGGG